MCRNEEDDLHGNRAAGIRVRDMKMGIDRDWQSMLELEDEDLEKDSLSESENVDEGADGPAFASIFRVRRRLNRWPPDNRRSGAMWDAVNAKTLGLKESWQPCQEFAGDW